MRVRVGRGVRGCFPFSSPTSFALGQAAVLCPTQPASSPARGYSRGWWVSRPAKVDKVRRGLESGAGAHMALGRMPTHLTFISGTFRAGLCSSLLSSSSSVSQYLAPATV